MRDLMDTRDGATYMAGRVWGVCTHYDLGGGHPLVGHSVPNFEFEDGAKIGELMRAGQAVLLDFEGMLPSKRSRANTATASSMFPAGRRNAWA